MSLSQTMTQTENNSLDTLQLSFHVASWKTHLNLKWGKSRINPAVPEEHATQQTESPLGQLILVIMSKMSWANSRALHVPYALTGNSSMLRGNKPLLLMTLETWYMFTFPLTTLEKWHISGLDSCGLPPVSPQSPPVLTEHWLDCEWTYIN